VRRCRWFVLFCAALLLAAASVTLFANPQAQQGSAQNAPTSSEKNQPEKHKAAKGKETSSQDKGAENVPRTATQGKAAATREANSTSESSQPPASNRATQSAPRTNPSSNGLVWVNTETRVFHKPGSRWYGKTKHGKYMTEADARRAGYRPASKE
jgi:cytoskeletal protein RodZ